MSKVVAIRHSTVVWVTGTMTIDGRHLTLNLSCSRCLVTWNYKRFCGNINSVKEKALTVFGMEHTKCIAK